MSTTKVFSLEEGEVVDTRIDTLLEHKDEERVVIPFHFRPWLLLQYAAFVAFWMVWSSSFLILATALFDIVGYMAGSNNDDGGDENNCQLPNVWMSVFAFCVLTLSYVTNVRRCWTYLDWVRRNERQGTNDDLLFDMTH